MGLVNTTPKTDPSIGYGDEIASLTAQVAAATAAGLTAKATALQAELDGRVKGLIGDPGSAYSRRNDRILARRWSTGGIYELSVEELGSGTNGGEINVLDFGADLTGFADSTAAINAALALGLPVLFPVGVYKISTPLIMTRGSVLRGAGHFDNVPGHSAIIKLADNSNCVMLQTPWAATGATDTEYLGVERISFDGNGPNQTVQHDAIQWHGVYIGSFLRDVMVSNVLGRGITCKYTFDTEFDNVWVIANQADYGVSFEASNGVDIVGTLDIRQLYVENIAKPAGGGGWQAGRDPRNVAADRSDAIRVYRVQNFIASMVHIEGARVAIDCDYFETMQIGSLTMYWMGSATADRNSGLRLGDNTFRAFRLGASYVNQAQANFKIVARATAVGSNNLVAETHAIAGGFSVSLGMLQTGVYTDDQRDDPILPYKTRIQDVVRIVKQDAYAASGVEFCPDSADLTKRILFKHTADAVEVWGNYGAGVDTQLMKIWDSGNEGRQVLFSVPIRLPSLDAAIYGSGNLDTYALFYHQGLTAPCFRFAGGGAIDDKAVATIVKGAAAPVVNAQYVGQIAVATGTGKVYIAIAVGGGAADWAILN